MKLKKFLPQSQKVIKSGERKINWPGVLENFNTELKNTWIKI